MSQFLRSLVRSEAKSCGGKTKYPRADSAERNARAMEAKKGNGEVFEHYQCEFCVPNAGSEVWHIGHRTNFDWIPKSHKAQHIMISKYKCFMCDGTYFYTSTVFANRILEHFPGVRNEPEQLVKCTACKSDEDFNPVDRIIINLELIPEDSEDSLESLWAKYSEDLSDC